MSLTALLGFDTFYKKAFISFSIIQWVITISKVSLPFSYKILILGVYIPITIKSKSLPLKKKPLPFLCVVHGSISKKTKNQKTKQKKPLC